MLQSPECAARATPEGSLLEGNMPCCCCWQQGGWSALLPEQQGVDLCVRSWCRRRHNEYLDCCRRRQGWAWHRCMLFIDCVPPQAVWPVAKEALRRCARKQLVLRHVRPITAGSKLLNLHLQPRGGHLPAIGGAQVLQAPGGGAPCRTSESSREVRVRWRGSVVSFTRKVLGSSRLFTKWACCT